MLLRVGGSYLCVIERGEMMLLPGSASNEVCAIVPTHFSVCHTLEEPGYGFLLSIFYR